MTTLARVADEGEPRLRVFLGAASESNELVRGLSAALKEEKRLLVRRWQEVFDASPNGTTLGILVETAKTYDFAAFLLSADDLTVLRQRDTRTTRSNTVFEAGLFIGAMGTERVFLFVADDWSVDVPSDLAGVLIKRWDAGDEDARSAFSVPAHQCIRSMLSLGARRSAVPAPPVVPGRVGVGGALSPEGGADVWRQAARAAALIPATHPRLDLDATVVHRAFGLGRVVEIGPQRAEAARYVTVEFEPGEFSEVLMDRLFLPRFPDPSE